MSRRALVTGADGFLGRAIVRALAEAGAEVLALGRRPGLPPPPGAVERLACDLADPRSELPALDRLGVSVVAHAAGMAGTPRDAAGRRALYAANLDAVERILDAAEASATRPRVISIASAAIYGGSESPLSEDAPLRPLSAYGVSKAAGALAVRMRREVRGLDAVVAVPFNLIGRGQPDALVPQTFVTRITAARGKPGRLAVGDLTAIRDWLDVDDAADAVASLALGRAPEPVYNICTGRGVSVGDVLHRLLTLSGSRLNPESEPSRMRISPAPCAVGDPARLIAATGWQPRRTLDQSLRAMLAAATAEQE